MRLNFRGNFRGFRAVTKLIDGKSEILALFQLSYLIYSDSVKSSL